MSNISDAQIREILELAIWSPSGDNCQPWSFQWDGHKLSFIHDPVRAKHPLNLKGIASTLALGCLIESLDIAASVHHFEVKTHFKNFEPEAKTEWANIEFVPAQRPTSPMAQALGRRCTDRRLYTGGKLSDKTLSQLALRARELSSVNIHVLSQIPAAIKDYATHTETVLFSVSQLLSSLFEWVRLTKTEVQSTRDGMTWRNLGVRAWEYPTVYALRKFPFLAQVMRPFLAQQHVVRVRKQIDSSAGLVCISVLPGDDHAIVNAGRLFMHAWLAFNEIGYGVQPITIPSMLAYAAETEILGEALNDEWKNNFKNGVSLLRKEFSIPENYLPIWMMRTGSSKPLPPEIRTLRRPLEQVFHRV